MKLGFICLNLPGHLNPMTTLARHLQDRNHEVVFLYSSGAAGLPFVRSPEKDHVDGQRPQVSKLQGEDALKFGLGTVLAQTKTILRTLPAVVQTTEIDTASRQNQRAPCVPYQSISERANIIAIAFG
jgi:zeaxanthin glucosyltransferase